MKAPIKFNNDFIANTNNQPAEEQTMKNTTTVKSTLPFRVQFEALVGKVVADAFEGNEELQNTLKAMREAGALNVTVAGGYFRDTLVGRPFSDIDIFVPRQHSSFAIDLMQPDERTSDEYSIPSYRKGNINFVLGGTELEDFTANISKIGVEVDLFKKTYEVIMDVEGMLDLIYRKRVLVCPDIYNSWDTVKYVSKMLDKFPEYEFYYQYKHCRVPVNRDKIKFIKEHHEGFSYNLSYTISCSPDLTPEEYKAESDKVLESLNYLRDVADIHLSSNMEMLEKMGNYCEVMSPSDVLSTLDISYSKRDRLLEQMQAEIQQTKGKSYFNGWDGYSAEGIELLRQGKARLALVHHNEPNYVLTQVLRQKGINLVVGSSYCFFSGNMFGNPWVLTGAVEYDTLIPRLQRAKLKDHMVPRHDDGLVLFISEVELEGLLAWTEVLGDSVKHVTRYDLMHYPKHNLVVPKQHQHFIATRENVKAWLAEHKLDVDWSASKNARECIIRALAKQLGVDDERVLDTAYKTPRMALALDWYKDNKDSVATWHVLPETSYRHNEWTLEPVAKDDIMNLQMGHYTSCCQSIGSAGETVCTEGWSDNYSVNYVFKQDGVIKAHMWLWFSQEGEIIIDSIEGRSETDTQAIAHLVKLFASDNKDVMLGQTGMGLTRDIISIFRPEVCRDVTPITDYTYRDAKAAYVI